MSPVIKKKLSVVSATSRDTVVVISSGLISQLVTVPGLLHKQNQAFLARFPIPVDVVEPGGWY